MVLTFNLACAWEAVSDVNPEADALICGDDVTVWRDFEQRSARIASGLSRAGLGQSDHVGLCLFNCSEFLEAEFGAMKQRCFPFNINYRYTASELALLLDNADTRAVFFSAELVDRFEELRERTHNVALFVQVGGSAVPDWAIGFETLIENNEPAHRIDRSSDDLWLLFTGGTTGQPKGVMWPHSSLVEGMELNYRSMGMSLPTNIHEVASRVSEIQNAGFMTRQLAGAPLMHGTAGITALATLTQGGAVLTLRGQSFDAHAFWSSVQQNRATQLTIAGDVFSRPMIAALDEAKERGEPYDLSSIFLIVSSGVMWSAPMKAALLDHNPKMKLFDSLGSSEGSGFARKIEGGGQSTSTARFDLSSSTRVLNDKGVDVIPGSGERGRLAMSGGLPLGYYKDPIKTAETFPVIQGVRYSIPGDWATVEADGSIVLLGRGSACINTGGEKVYPEEVEEALKLVEGVIDVNVIGVSDDRWGEVVVAVFQLSDDYEFSREDMETATSEFLAGYKIPKYWVQVPTVLRGPNGKSDYGWARETAIAALNKSD